MGWISKPYSMKKPYCMKKEESLKIEKWHMWVIYVMGGMCKLQQNSGYSDFQKTMILSSHFYWNYLEIYSARIPWFNFFSKL